MSLRHQVWQTLSGGPITGQTPPVLRIMNDKPLTPGQMGMVAHHYKLLEYMKKVSVIPYLVQERTLVDGTRIRMVSSYGVDTVMVWPTGGEEEETQDRFMGGIAIQFEKVTFNPNGSDPSNADSDFTGTVWVGSKEVIDGARSVALPSNMPGTATRVEVEGVVPEDLVIWIHPSAKLDQNAIKDGTVKIRRAKVERGTHLDVNFGQSEDGNKVVPRNLISVDFGSLAETQAFYLCGKKLPFPLPIEAGESMSFPGFVFSLGFDVPYNWKENQLEGLLVFGAFEYTEPGVALLRVWATTVKRGVIGGWAELASNVAIPNSREQHFVMTWRKLPGVEQKSEFTIRTAEWARTLPQVSEAPPTGIKRYDTTVVVTVPKRIKDLQNDVSCTIDTKILEIPPAPPVSISITGTYTLSQRLSGSETLYGLFVWDVASYTYTSDMVYAKNGTPVTRHTRLIDVSLVLSTAAYGNVLELQVPNNMTPENMPYLDTSPHDDLSQAWPQEVLDARPPFPEGGNITCVEKLTTRLTWGTTYYTLDRSAFVLSVRQSETETISVDGVTKTASFYKDENSGPALLSEVMFQGHRKPQKFSFSVADGYYGECDMEIELSYDLVLDQTPDPAGSAPISEATFSDPILRVAINQPGGTQQTVLWDNMYAAFDPPVIWWPRVQKVGAKFLSYSDDLVTQRSGEFLELSPPPDVPEIQPFPHQPFDGQSHGFYPYKVGDTPPTISVFSKTVSVDRDELVDTASLYGGPFGDMPEGLPPKVYVPIRAMSDTPFLGDSKWNQPNYRQPAAQVLAYDPRTRSFFAYVAVHATADGGKYTQKTTMIVGNSSGTTDFYPLLNAWLEAEHKAADDNITEVYGSGNDDAKIIVGLNLYNPTLV